MNYRINNFYPLQVWLLTIVTAPMIIGVALVEWEHLDLEEVTRTMYFIGMGMLLGGGLSLPTLAFYYLSFLLITRIKIPEPVMKGLLALIAIVGFVASFYVIGLDLEDFTNRDMVLPLSYFLCIIGFSSLFHIRRPLKKREPAGTEDAHDPTTAATS